MSLLLDALKKAALEKQQNEDKLQCHHSDDTNAATDESVEHDSQSLAQYESTKKSIEENIKKAEQVSASFKSTSETTASVSLIDEVIETQQQALEPVSIPASALPNTTEETEVEVEVPVLDLTLDPEQFITIEDKASSKEIISEPTDNQVDQSIDEPIEEHVSNSGNSAAQYPDNTDIDKPPVEMSTKTHGATETSHPDELSSFAHESQQADDRHDTIALEAELKSEAAQQKKAIRVLIEKGKLAKKKQNLLRVSILTVLLIACIAGIGVYAYLRLGPNSTQVIHPFVLPINNGETTELLSQVSSIDQDIGETNGNQPKIISSPPVGNQNQPDQTKTLKPEIIATVDLTNGDQKPIFPSRTDLPRQIVKISAAEIEKHRLRNLGPNSKIVPNAKPILPKSTASLLPATASSSPKATVISAEVEQGYTYYINTAYKAWLKRDWPASKRFYNKALELQPNSRDALLGAAVVATQLGNYQSALKLFQRRLERAPKDEYAITGILGLVDLSLANHSFESEVNNLLSDYPEAAHLHYIKGALHANREQWQAAQEHFFAAWKNAPDQPDYLYNLAISMDQLGLYKEALIFYKQVEKVFSRTQSEIPHSDLRSRISILESHYQQ